MTMRFHSFRPGDWIQVKTDAKCSPRYVGKRGRMCENQNVEKPNTLVVWFPAFPDSPRDLHYSFFEEGLYPGPECTCTYPETLDDPGHEEACEVWVSKQAGSPRMDVVSKPPPVTRRNRRRSVT